MPILQALNITRETAGNVVIADAIDKVHDAVKEGESSSHPLEASTVFPPMVISMVDVGEETGQLPEMLLKIADVYDDEVDNAVSGLTSMLEPIMIVFLALDRRRHRDCPLHAAHQHHQRPAVPDVTGKAFPARGAFTLIELLVVITIIIILAGLILGTSNYVQKKGARSRAQAEIAAMSAALENYKADNGTYPSSADTNSLTTSTTNPANYPAANLVLYRALSGDDDLDAQRKAENRAYMTFQPNQLSPPQATGGAVQFIRDPFGDAYGYSTAGNPDLNPGGPGTGSRNPTFDLWTVADEPANEPSWLTNW